MQIVKFNVGSDTVYLNLAAVIDAYVSDNESVVVEFEKRKSILMTLAEAKPLLDALDRISDSRDSANVSDREADLLRIFADPALNPAE